MTVSTTQNRVSYAGNGVTSAFSFPYVFFDNADLVVLNVKADGTYTKAVLGTDYTVTGAGADSGGTVTMTTAPAVGATLVVYRDPAMTQPQAFVDNDPLPAKSISRGYDRLTLIGQRLRELVDRSFRLSDSDTSGASPVLPIPTPNAFIGWNGVGNGLVNRSITDLITISAYGTAVADKFVGDGAKVDFTLSANPGALANLDVSISGITQEAGRDFTWDGATKLSFVSAPPAPGTPGDTNVYVRYLRALPQGVFDLTAAPFTQLGTGAITRTGLDKLRESVSALDFGMDPTGATDSTTAFQSALASGAKHLHIPAGRYLLNRANAADMSVIGLSNMLITGDGPSTVLFIYGRNLCFKSPSHVTFRALRFEGNPTMTDTAGQPTSSIWCSNFIDVTFDNCEFSSFGGTTYPNGTTCLYMYAGPASNVAAAGSSEGALISNCRFYGNSRQTNFGVRVFTEWTSGASLAYANTGAIIKGCTFGGFNWNAVELTGPMTSNALVADCVANVCGLAPFDIDKGPSNCRVNNVTINRLLGNIDTAASPSTRACVAEIQGEPTVGRIAQNCHIDGVVANLLASDIQAFAGFGGYAAVGYSMAKNCTIRNVQVSVDAVPTKNAAAAFALAMVCTESTSGCDVDNLKTTNATVGVIETNPQLSAVGSDTNNFSNLQNIGALKSEAISIAKSSANIVRHRLRNVRLTSDMSLPINASAAVINLQVASTSPYTAIILEDVAVSTPGFTAITANVPRLGVSNVAIEFAANSNHTNLFSVGATLANLYIDRVYFNGKPLDVSAGFTNLPSTCTISSARLIEGGGVSWMSPSSGTPMHATAIPTNPAPAYWTVPAIVWNLLPSAGGKAFWVNYGGFWKGSTLDA